MFELFNEPANQPVSTPTTNPGQSTWIDWLSGGRLIGPGSGWAAYVPVGHQDLVNYLRNTLNVPNVLIADGASKGEHLEGMPQLQDPGGANQIAYALHPYAYTDGQAAWDTRWGYLAATNALIATEWNYTSSGCSTSKQLMAPQLLSYLRESVNVGVLGHALDDYGGAIVSDGALSPTQCGTSHPGSGQDFLQDYLATFPTAVVDTAVANGGLAPVSPGGLAVAYGPSRITLTWAAAEDPDGAVTAYDVYRDGVRVATTAGLTYADYPIATGTAHTYVVDAVDSAGNVSPPSPPLVAVAPDSTAPSAPTGLKATVAAQSVTVSWTASTDNVGVAGYRVSRNGSLLTTTTSKSYTDTAVTQGSSYTYQVVAFDAAGNVSAPATKTVVFPDTIKPTAPTKLTLTPGSKSIALKWAAATDNVGVKSYRIYRFSTLIATVASPTLTYTNTGLTTGTSYSYHLTAVDAAGNVSAASATVSAKAK
jgi:chitodextrinase